MSRWPYLTSDKAIVNLEDTMSAELKKYRPGHVHHGTARVDIQDLQRVIEEVRNLESKIEWWERQEYGR